MRRAGVVLGALLVAGLSVAGCRGPGTKPAASSAGNGALAGAAGSSASAAGWNQRSGQAVWRSKAGAEEIPGDLAWALEPAGGYVLEFSKPALPLVRVSRSIASGGRWSVSAAGRGERSGRGRSPSFSWFVLGAYLAGQPVPGSWSAGVGAEPGSFWVEHRKTGERIEGFLEGR